MTKKKAEISKAFLSAPARIDLHIIIQELQGREIEPIIAYNIPSRGLFMTEKLEKAIRSCDFFVAVIPEDFSPNVFFELGIAQVLRKRILLFISPKLKDIPSDITEMMYFRSESNNREAIAFAFDQLLASHKHKTFRPREYPEEGHPLGGRADTYLRRVQEKGISLKGHELEKMVAEILKASGISIVSLSKGRNLGVDFAVWSDDLQAFVDNPLPIEVKTSVRSTKDLEKVINQVEQYRIKSGAKWALLVLSSAVASFPIVGRVLAVTLTELLERLRTRSFTQVIRELRNKHVHSGLK